MSELKQFQDVELIIIDTGKQKALTTEAVGKALDYSDPHNAVALIHRRSEEEFRQGVDWDWYDIETGQIVRSGEGRYCTRVYYEPGVYLICFKSNKPKAVEFHVWARDELAERNNPDIYTVAEIARNQSYERRCKICRSPHHQQINDMLDNAVRYTDIIDWAAERGLNFTQSSLSRHNHNHRIPDPAPKTLAMNPELGMAILFTKLLDVMQRRNLEALGDRDLVKYSQAAGATLLAHRRSPALPPSE